MLLHLVKQIFQLLDLNEYTPEKEKTFHEQCVPALCDFAASCSYYLIHPEEWFTATRVYSTLSQLTATAITADIYITTLQIGCIKLMRKFAQDDIPCSSNVNILVGTVRAFEPLIQYDDDYAVHLGSLLCACIHRLSIKLMVCIFRFMIRQPDAKIPWNPTMYSSQSYSTILPSLDVIASTNVAFIITIYKNVEDLVPRKSPKGVGLEQEGDKLRRAIQRCTMQTVKYFARSSQMRSYVHQVLLFAEHDTEFRDCVPSIASIFEQSEKAEHDKDNRRRREKLEITTVILLKWKCSTIF